MNNQIFAIAIGFCLGSFFVLLRTFADLRARHRALKETLNRVASERDHFRWHGSRLAENHPGDADAIAIINHHSKGGEGWKI